MKGNVISIFAIVPILSLSVQAEKLSSDTCSISASVTQSLSICSGQGGAVLTASGGTSYSWAPSTGLNSATIANPLANPALTTTYTVTVSNSPSCSQTATVTVTVNPIPVIVANASPAIQCAGSAVNLTASGGDVYYWSNGNGGNLITVFPASTTTYTVTGTASTGGCSSTTTVTATINPPPTIKISPSAPSSCEGTVVTLIASGANTYLWSSGATGATISVSPSSTTTYAVTGTTSVGCVNTGNVTVTLPSVSANASSIIVCQGTKVTLDGAGAQSYTWSGSVKNGVAFAPATTTTYTVTGTESNGCKATSTVTITVNPIPDITATASASSVCAGTFVTLTGGDVLASNERNNSNGGVVVNGVNAPTYSWSDSETDGIAFAPAKTTTYTVTGTDGYGCTNTATVKVVVDPLPVITAIASATTLCPGATVTLTGGGGNKYSWSNGVVNGVSFVPVATDTYTVTGTNVNGCVNTATVEVIVGTPIAPFGDWCGGYNTDWFNCLNWKGCSVPIYTTDVTIKNGAANMPVINPAIAQCHNLTIESHASLLFANSDAEVEIYGDFKNANSSAGSFNATSGNVQFLGSPSQALGSELNQKGGDIYPNPNNGNMVFKYDLAEGTIGMMEIYSITGKLINTFKLQTGSEITLNISEPGLENGIYFYRQIVNGETLSQGKLAIIK